MEDHSKEMAVYHLYIMHLYKKQTAIVNIDVFKGKNK